MNKYLNAETQRAQAGGAGNPKPETRNPKPEGNPKAEIRRPQGGAKFFCERRFLSGGPFNRRDAKSTARRSCNQMEDRQNHGGTESWGTKTESGLADHSRRGRMNLLFMILSRHDSVGPSGWRKDSSQLANNFGYSRAEMRREGVLPSLSVFSAFLRVLCVSALKFYG